MYNAIRNYKGTSPRKYTLITGEKRDRGDPQVIAYCVSLAHQRFLTLSDIVKHQCFFKKCPYLRKLPDRVFWQTEPKEYTKQMLLRYSKEGQCLLKQQKLSWEKDRKEKEVLLLKFCENWVKEHDLESTIKVVRVQPFDNSTKNYRLYYVSDTSAYDAPMYLGLVRAVQEEFRIRLKLVHIKDVDGTWVTIDSYNCKKK